MTDRVGRVPDGTGLSQAEPSSTVSALTGFDPSREEAGRAAYEEDCRRCPTYVFGTDPETGKPADGTKRRLSWDEIEEAARESWRADPTPTDYYGD
jgi:hypothetical protein